jgi:N-acetylglucosaminyldiphosphoundecaprenol N-acetyl-beta-D-mannosaminyltransferase
MADAGRMADSAQLPRGREGRVRFLGIETDVVTKRELIDFVLRAIDDDRRVVIGNHNLHSLYLFPRDSRFREFFAMADRIFIDGAGAIAAGRIFGARIGRRHRATFLDFGPELLSALAARACRVYCLGSRPGVQEKAVGVFRERFPGLTIMGNHGYFDASASSPENEAILEQIAALRPHLLMVGMGMPRQEQWIAENHTRLQANVTMSLGCFMDYYAGTVSAPPRWSGRLGLEWAFRLVAEPRRLWRRYLLEPWFVLAMLARELVAGSYRQPPRSRGWE